MAETVHLYLKANGSDIKGESTQHSMGRQDSIECTYYEQKVVTAREAGSGQATGRRQYEPLLIRKRIDKASPLIAKALVENQVIEGVFKFFVGQVMKATRGQANPQAVSDILRKLLSS